MNDSYRTFIKRVSGEIKEELETSSQILLIGKNGRGKSNILASLAKDLPSSGRMTLAISFSVTDKFPFSSKNYYKYLGVKSTSNSTHTNTIDNKIFDALIAGSNSESFEEKIIKICEFLEIPYGFRIRGDIYSGFSESDIESYIAKALSARRGKSRLSQEIINNAEKLNSEINKILKAEAIDKNAIARLLGNRNPTQSKHILDEEFSLKEPFRLKDYASLPGLRKLGVIRNFSLSIGSDEAGDLNYLSSGQKNIFFTLVQASLHIEQGAALLIDEPEISLHPDWQARYIPLLDELFSDYKAKLIIATHSPFIAVNSHNKNTTIFSLTKEDNNLACEKISSMEGWSIDIASVDGFKVGSYRSAHLEVLLLEACKEIESKQPSRDKINNLIDSFESLSLSQEDPIQVIIKDLRNLRSEQ